MTRFVNSFFTSSIYNEIAWQWRSVIVEESYMGMDISYKSEGIDCNTKLKRPNKGNSIIAFPSTYCVLDLETTGIYSTWDEIIEIAAIKYQDGKEIGRFQTLMQPSGYGNGHFVSAFVTGLTGITDDMLMEAPGPSVVLPAFAEFLGDMLIIGYNVSFDVNFLYDAFVTYLNRPLNNDFIDCMRIARRLYPELEHHRLCDITEKIGVINSRAHRAMSDVEATQACYILMSEEVKDRYGDQESFVSKFKNKSTVRAKQIVRLDDVKLDPDNPLFGKVCVFTGKLEKFERRIAMQLVANIGGINGDGVTKKTNYLILGNNDYCSTIRDGKSSKLKKAEQYKLDGFDIEIIPETMFYEMISDFLEGE